MHNESNEPKTFGIIAEYDDPDAIVKAAMTAYQDGYRDMDAYSPFPVHGLAEAIGFHKTILPVFTLIAGLTGAASGFLLQYIGSVVHYPYEIAGRPYYSWPAWIPVTFEMTILFASFTTGIAMILLNGLPRPYHSVFNAKNFERATSDRFFLCIEATDNRYDPVGTRSYLEGLNPRPLDVSEVPE